MTARTVVDVTDVGEDRLAVGVVGRLADAAVQPVVTVGRLQRVVLASHLHQPVAEIVHGLEGQAVVDQIAVVVVRHRDAVALGDLVGDVVRPHVVRHAVVSSY